MKEPGLIYEIMARKERHVVPKSDKGGWDSKRENAERASKHFETK